MTSIAPLVSSTTNTRSSLLELPAFSSRRDSRHGPSRRAFVHFDPNCLISTLTRAPRAHLTAACHHQSYMTHGSVQHAPPTCTATTISSPTSPSSPTSSSAATTPATAADSTLADAANRSPSESPDPSPHWLQRTALLLGPSGLSSLADCRVLVVGLGGVGSFVAEFLTRAGVGSLAIVDGDVVDITNKNRQLPALDSTIGQSKVQVMAARLRDINPALNLVVRQEFLMPDEAAERLLDEVAAELHAGAQSVAAAGEVAAAAVEGSGRHIDCDDTTTAAAAATSMAIAGRHEGTSAGALHGHKVGASDGQGLGAREEGCRGGGGGGGGAATVRGSGRGPQPSPLSGAARDGPRFDWVVDCIDSVAPKLALVVAARARGSQVVSSMGAGGRLDPLAVRVADISETFGDPFAANVRRGLRRQHGIRDGVTAVFSVEPCDRSSLALTAGGSFKRSYYGTISYIPALFGLTITAHIVNSVVQGPMLASEAKQRRQLARERGTSPGAPPGEGPTRSMGRKGKGAAPPADRKAEKDVVGNGTGDGGCSKSHSRNYGSKSSSGEECEMDYREDGWSGVRA